MKKVQKLISLLLAIFMVATIIPSASIMAMAQTGTSSATVTVEKVNALPGKTVNVNVSISGNPGVLGATLNVEYDESVLTLVSATAGDAFKTLSMTAPGKYGSPCRFGWDGVEINDSDIKDGTFLILSFLVSNDAEVDTEYPVKVSAESSDWTDKNLQPVELTIVNGAVNVISYTYGDVNDDGNINMTDVILSRRFIVGGYDTVINEAAADVNMDSNINMTDVIYTRRYIVGGYGVTLPVHTHNLTAVEAKAATCLEAGNKAYWQCSICNELFSDKTGVTKTTIEDTVVDKTGHTVVVDSYVAPTYDSTGLTEGSHCGVCEEVLVAQETIPALQKNEYAINYNITNNDQYLESLEIDNSINPVAYTSQDGASLRNLSVPGYVFEGWFDGMGSNAEQIKSIPAGTKGIVDLYAKWTPVKYNISFDNTGLFAVPSETYEVNQDKILPTPKLSGYVFVGWSNDDGEILSTIPMGSTYGHKTYTANWISERNKAETFKKIEAPTVYEDDERILFTYYIGKINNVPVSVINDFGYINEDGVSKTVTKTFSETIDDTQMKTLTNTVKKETTNSFGWSLSDSWNEGSVIDEGWLEKTGRSREEVEETCRNESNNWYVSSGSSGSSTVSSMNSSDSYNNNSSEFNVNTRNKTQVKTDDTVSASLKSTVSAEVGAGYGPFSAKVGTSVDSGVSAVSNVKTDRLSDVKTNSTISNNNGTASHAETSASNTSSWNSESGRGGSSSTTQSNKVAETVSSELSKNYNLQTSYLKSNTQSETQGHEDSSSNQDEYSSAVTYSTITGKEDTQTYTTTNTKTGYHRWILAGTAHVFGQVGYDIASNSYFVSTFTMMDDKVHQFEDYSYRSADYNDFENTVITFEAPNDITAYVNNRICESEGLEVSKSGVVTKYTGTDKNVIVPEYKVFDNQDGTTTAVKVTGIESNVFAGKDIESVELSDFITEIPEGAFENCTSLTHVNALGVTKIGDRAFAGCTSIEELQVCEQVTELGENVVSNDTRLYVEAIKKDVVEAAVKSNAKSIMISILDECTDLKNVTLEVPSTTEKLLINGFGKTFDNVRIKSDAQKTILNRVNFNTTGSIPIILSSENVELHEVSISSSGIGLALTNVLTNLALRGNCYINSENENSILCKNIVTRQIDSKLTTILKVNGNILSCGGISENISLLSYGDKEIEPIDQETFDKYLAGQFVVTFDAGEGTVDELTRDMFYGDKIGELPEPTRDYYRFDGWYTEKGEKVTATTSFSTPDDITLVARWTENELSDWTLLTEMPADATAENTKYTYTLRSYTTSGSSSMSGWTKYDTQRTSWSSWSSWSKTNPTGNGRNVESKTVTDSAAYTNYNYYYYRYWNSSANAYYYTYSSSMGGTKYTKTLTSPMVYYKDYSGHAAYVRGSGSYYNFSGEIWFLESTQYVAAKTHTEWRYQDPVYTYYYYQDNDKESTTDPTGQSNVSNVQEWVQYRVK